MAARDYSPLEIGELASSVMNALLRQELLPLPPTAEFLGTGLYAIYYQGAYPEYQPISELNRGDPGSCPIYIGKAVPPGSRKGLPGEGEAPKGPFLFRRLREHAESIQQATNLDLRDFSCRHLTTDPVWIPLGERLLIQRFRPVWNTVVDGFGNHDPGSGRKDQQRSPWDELHPGRRWAEGLAPIRSGLDEIIQALRAELAATSGKASS